MRTLCKIAGTGMLLAVAVMIATPAYAGGCGQLLTNYARNYQTQNYQAQNYQQTYYAQVVAVPVALFQFVQPPVTTVTQTTTQTTAQTTAASGAVVQSQGTVGTSAPPQSLLSDAQVRLLAAEIVKGLKEAPPEMPPPERVAPPKNPAPMKKEGVNTSQAVPAASKLVLSYQVAAISASRCMECHTQGSEKGKVALFNTDGQYGPNVTPSKLYEAVRDDHMPDKGKKLTSEEKDVFRQLALGS